MARTSAAVITAFGLATALVACSGGDPGPTDPCVKNPKGQGCTAAPATSPATSATPYEATPAPSTPPPPVPTSPDAGTPAVRPPAPSLPTPPAFGTPCNDLLRCCAKVANNVERAGCMLIAYNANLDICITTVVACETGVLSSLGSSSPTPDPSDPCSGFSSSTQSNGQNDYQCCVYGYSSVPIACCGTDNAGCEG